MALGLATLSGCSDFLDQNNKSNVFHQLNFIRLRQDSPV